MAETVSRTRKQKKGAETSPAPALSLPMAVPEAPGEAERKERETAERKLSMLTTEEFWEKQVDELDGWIELAGETYNAAAVAALTKRLHEARVQLDAIRVQVQASDDGDLSEAEAEEALLACVPDLPVPVVERLLEACVERLGGDPMRPKNAEASVWVTR